MAKTNWQDPANGEILSTHITALQEAVSKIEDMLDIETSSDTGIGLNNVNGYRIYQAPFGLRNWISEPSPIIYKNDEVITTGFTIDYAGGAIILDSPANVSDQFTADASFTIKSDKIMKSTGKSAINTGIIFYGTPININGINSVDGAISFYKNYNMIIFGDGQQLRTGTDLQNTIDIVTGIKEQNPEAEIFGYIPFGNRPGIDVCVTEDELVESIEKWLDVGVTGIFCDEYDCSYKVTRERMNTFTSIIHSYGLNLIANGFTPEHLFSTHYLSLDNPGIGTTMSVRLYGVYTSVAGIASITEGSSIISFTSVAGISVGNKLQFKDNEGNLISFERYYKWVIVNSIDEVNKTVTINLKAKQTLSGLSTEASNGSYVSGSVNMNPNNVETQLNDNDYMMFEGAFYDVSSGNLVPNTRYRLRKMYEYYYREDPVFEMSYFEMYGTKTVGLTQIPINEPNREMLITKAYLASIMFNINVFLLAPESLIQNTYGTFIPHTFPELYHATKTNLTPASFDSNSYGKFTASINGRNMVLYWLYNETLGTIINYREIFINGIVQQTITPAVFTKAYQDLLGIFGDSVPTSGDWANGTVINMSTVSAYSPLRYRCVQSGSFYDISSHPVTILTGITGNNYVTVDYYLNLYRGLYINVPNNGIYKVVDITGGGPYRLVLDGKLTADATPNSNLVISTPIFLPDGCVGDSDKEKYLKSENGTLYKLTVSNSGELAVTEV